MQPAKGQSICFKNYHCLSFEDSKSLFVWSRILYYHLQQEQDVNGSYIRFISSGADFTMYLKGVIFDLDGTLVDSALDFDLIRSDLGIPVGHPILEFLNEMEGGEEKTRLLSILREHELKGAERASPMPGVEDFLDELTARELKSGILTRNSREATDRSLTNLNMEFTHVLTREDCPHKPDPAGLLSICHSWNVEPAQVLYFGDYLFDLQAGQNASMPTVLFSPQKLPDYAHLADFTISHFAEAVAVLDRFRQ